MEDQKLIRICGKRKANPQSIFMLQADINYTRLYFNDGTTFVSANTLGIYEERLRDKSFFRASRSILFNMDYFMNFEEFDLVNGAPVVKLKNNQTFNLSRRRAEKFKKYLAAI